MRSKLLLVAVSLVAGAALIALPAASIRVAIAEEVKLGKDAVTTDLEKLFPAKAVSKSEKFYEGQVRNILSRKETFGFSVRNNSIPSEIGFYVENTEANKTIIETVLFAAKEKRAVRIYYDDTTYIADAVETWGW
jgi:hypothetical protein